MKLTKKQTLALDKLEDKITNELLFGGGAGGAKSVLGCYWILKSAFKYAGTRWVIGRATLKTLKETTLNSFYWVAANQKLKANQDYVFNAQSNIITLKNGSEILLKDLFQYPSDPNFDELGSLEITGAFVDECNQITEKAWEILKSRIRYKLDEYGLVPKMLGTCNPAKNFVYNRFYKPSKDGTLPQSRAFIQALINDNPNISKHYRENLAQMKDEASRQRLLLGNWEYDDDPAKLINYDKILDMFTNSFIVGGERFITADIARLGRDLTVIGVWDGFRLVEIKTIPKNLVTEAATAIQNMAYRHQVPVSNIIVDEDGVGGGVVDIVGCNGFVNNSSPLENPETKETENFNHLKSQCYFKLAELINGSKIYVNCTDISIKDKIIQELEQVKQHNMDKDGKKQVLPKDLIKELISRSPDMADMLMMRMWFIYRKKRKFSVA